jgi:branched-chain amino acid transport system substrate-binding protein
MKSFLRPFFLFPFSFFLASAGCLHRDEAEPVLVGEVLPFTGPDKYLGEHARQGTILAVEEANKPDNRIQGRRVAVVMPDSHGNREEIGKEAVRLVTVDRVVALLGGTEPGQVEGLAPVALSYRVPVVVGRGLPGRPVNEYVFQTGVAPAHRGRVLARFAAQELKKPGVLVLADAAEARAAASSAVADGFAAEYLKQGGSLAGELSFKENAKLKELAEQVRKKRPGAVLFAGAAADCVQLRNDGLGDVPVLFGGEEEGLKALQDSQGGGALYLATAYVPDGGGARAKEFAAKYQERVGEPPDIDAAAAYDNAGILFEAMRQAKSVEGAKVRQALADLKDFDSLTGPLSFNKDQWAVRRVFVVRIENNQVKAAKVIAPAGQ